MHYLSYHRVNTYHCELRCEDMDPQEFLHWGSSIGGSTVHVPSRPEILVRNIARESCSPFIMAALRPQIGRKGHGRACLKADIIYAAASCRLCAKSSHRSKPSALRDRSIFINLEGRRTDSRVFWCLDTQQRKEKATTDAMVPARLSGNIRVSLFKKNDIFCLSSKKEIWTC